MYKINYPCLGKAFDPTCRFFNASPLKWGSVHDLQFFFMLFHNVKAKLTASANKASNDILVPSVGQSGLGALLVVFFGMQCW